MAMRGSGASLVTTRSIGTLIMLPICDLSGTELDTVRTACAHLFSPQLARSDEFLKSLKSTSVRDAFRKKAKQYHPDLHRDEPEEMAKEREERFMKIKESYGVLEAYTVEGQESASEQTTRFPKIIAVGGAKGGIGKSIFAANLGIILSRKGYRTVLVDLDLGGANLHLYLGQTSVSRTINDFLNNSVPTLKEIMVPTRFGVKFIGGDSSELGTANINFLRKLKLLKHLRMVDADYVVIDLGGDTSYNIIDFFLAADHGIVMTTCDPASYLDAYNFIKVALYRKLNRLFGPESTLKSQEDKGLIRLIREATISSSENKVKNIAELVDRVTKEQPQHVSLVTDVLEDYSPNLLVNMVGDDSSATEVVYRIQEVSGRMLSTHVTYLGSLPYQSEVETSARKLVPVAAKHPKGIFSERLGQIIDKLGS